MRKLGLMCVLVLIGCHHQHATGNDDAGGTTDDMSASSFDGFVPKCQPGLVSLTISPGDSSMTLDGSTPSTITFTVTGMFSDGHMATVDPSLLGWTVTRPDSTPPGMIDGSGTLTPNQAGGVLTITATDGCVTGSTTLTLQLNVTIGTPKNPADWTGTPVSTGMIPTMIYPSDQTRFPRNIYRTLFQWRTAGYSQFRLTFTGPGSTVTVYTDGANPLCAAKTPAAGCWEADESAWTFIAGSNSGATVTWTVDGLDGSTSPATIRRGKTPAPAALDKVTIGFSQQDVVGAVFYWSTTSAGIRRANIADAAPEDYITGVPGTTYSTPVDKVKCVACHVVSRDGKYLVAPVSAMSGNSLWVAEVTKVAPPNPLVKSIANTGGHGFGTISPDDNTVVASFNGKLWTVDRATGAFGANITLTPFAAGTQPDWSPDNKQLVFATGNGDAPGMASLALLPYNNPGWGTPVTLVAAGGSSNLFPMFSPDGKWIAYSRGKGGHGDLTAQLWVVGGSVGSTPVEMINANRMVSGILGNGQTENSQPTWAPPGDLYWVAFNSQREYGVVSKAGTQQIWVAAVDPSKLGGTTDPSFPAFRLQFQGLTENNHRAFWTLDVRDTPVPDAGTPIDMATGACKMANAMCDPSTDCCPNGYLCDTADNGMTYTCTQQIL
jgi:hypothetical protein